MAQLLNTLCFTSPDFLGLRRESQHAVFFHFADEESSRQYKRNFSPYCRDLSGEWSFYYTESPAELTTDIIKQDYDVSNWEKVAVPDCWATRGHDYPHYTNVKMPFAGEPPFEIPDRNPTGVYRRTFTVPENWDGRKITLWFEGCEGYLEVFVNGKAVGASKENRTGVEFDVTGFLVTGENILTAVVVKWSDATYLEDQDHWYLPGLSRPVYLLSAPRDYSIVDVFAKTDLDDAYRDGILKLEAKCAFPMTLTQPPELRLHLYNPAGVEVLNELLSPQRNMLTARNHTGAPLFWTGAFPYCGEFKLPEAARWSAETPNLYTATLEFCNPEGVFMDAVSVRCGFKRYETKQRNFLINGQRVLISGTNRHDHTDDNGKAVTMELMELDVKTMKRLNINAVRTSHYPNRTEFCDLCDEYGLYMISEANLEHHRFIDDLSHCSCYAGAFADRMARMVERDKNHPCIYAWSLGNESGAGANQGAQAGYVRFRDPSRLVHYEGGMKYLDFKRINFFETAPDPLLTDFICPMYPNVPNTEKWSANVYDERPFIACEYGHSMGNSLGRLDEYFHAFRTLPGVQGGFIWEWMDHGIKYTCANGKSCWGYGGDFGDQPNDINFCVDGCVWPDRTPHPEMEEFKYLAQPVDTKLADAGGRRLSVCNRRYFTDLSDLALYWQVEYEGETLLSGVVADVVCAPQSKIELPLLDRGFSVTGNGKLLLKLEYRLKRATRDGGANYVLAHETLEIQPENRTALPVIQVAAAVEKQQGGFRLTSGALQAEITASGLQQLTRDGVELLSSGPRIQLWRAAVDNDGFKLDTTRKNRALVGWVTAGYDRFTVCDGEMTVSGKGVKLRHLASAPGIPDAELVFTEYFEPLTSGGILWRLEYVVPDAMPDLPRLGVVMTLPDAMNQVEYFGRGPWDNYRDRNASAHFGTYRTTAQDMFVPYIMPQSCGNRTQVNRLEIAGGGRKFALRALGEMEFSCLPYSEAALWHALHTAELETDGLTHLNIDVFQRGLGGRSCGPDAAEECKIHAGTYALSLILE